MKHLAAQEAANIINMHENNTRSASEIRHYTPSPDFIAQIQTLKDAPDWLPDALAQFTGNSTTVDKLIKTLRADVEKRGQEKDFTSVQVTACELIKSGTFGPGVEEFTMALPENFPALAGESKHANRAGLVEYEKLLSKLRVQGLPNTLKECYVPTAAERISSAYHTGMGTEAKRNLKKLKQALESEVRLHLLSERTYQAGRRETYVHLPGMVNHYPNLLYTVPALVIPTVNYDFDPADIKAGTIGPVGRKPSPAQLSEYHKIVDQIKAERMQKILGRTTEAPRVTKKPTKAERILMGSGSRKMPAASVAAVVASSITPVVSRAPAGSYLSRRGTCPVAPGLQEFQTSLVSSAGVIVDPFAPSKKFEQTDEVTVRADRGLVRRFLVNGLELAHHGSVNDAVFSPSESRVATAGGDTLIKIWDPRDGSFVCRLAGHSNEVLAVRYSSSEQFLVSASADSEILVWSMMSQTVARRLLGHVDVVYG